MPKTEETSLLQTPLISVSDAIDQAGCGCGNVLYMVGPYILIACDGAEVIIMSVLKWEWDLSTFQVFSLSVISLFGMFVGTVLFAGLIDTFGRRPVMLGSGVGMMTSGMLSALSPGFWTFMCCRFCVGIFSGGSLGASVAYLVEVAPTKVRVVAIAGELVAWAVGSIVYLLLAMLILPVYSWRVLIMTCTLVFTPGLVALYCAGESPRFDANKGRVESAARTLDRLYKYNCVPTPAPPIWTSLEYGLTGESNEVVDTKLWSSLNKGTNLRDVLFCFLYTFAALAIYYAYSFTVPRILNGDFCPGNPVRTVHHNATEVVISQHRLSNEAIRDLTITTALNPVGPLIAAVSAEWIGRRNTTYVAALLLLIFNSLVYTCISRTVLIVVLLIARTISKGINIMTVLASTFLQVSEGLRCPSRCSGAEVEL